MLDKQLATFLSLRNNAGLLRELAQPSSPRLNFSGHDYLGLGHHPLVLEKAQKILWEYGLNAASSRLITGNHQIHQDLEDQIAYDRGRCALILNSGYQANVSILEAILSKELLKQEPLVFADRLNHASMHAGCELAGVRQHRYQHLDLTHLEDLLKKYSSDPRPKFILTESLFSMDGDAIDLPALINLKHRYGAFLYIDEAHAVGMEGPKGYGITEGYEEHIDCILGTFSKAIGAFGAFVLTSELMKKYLVNACRGLIYSTALPPVVIGGIQAAWELLSIMNPERTHVKHLARLLEGASHIVPYPVESAQKALTLVTHLRERGIEVAAMRPPSVPSSRLRITLSATHSVEEVEFLKETLREVA